MSEQDWQRDPKPGMRIQERDRRAHVPRTIVEVDDAFVYMEGPPRTRIRRTNLRRYKLVGGSR